jgi:hypothetical protein
MLFNDYFLLKWEQAYLLMRFPENLFLVSKGLTGLHDLLFPLIWLNCFKTKNVLHWKLVFSAAQNFEITKEEIVRKVVIKKYIATLNMFLLNFSIKREELRKSLERNLCTVLYLYGRPKIKLKYLGKTVQRDFHVHILCINPKGIVDMVHKFLLDISLPY